MVRWRACLVLAVLLLLPRTGGKAEEEDDDESKQRDTVEDSDEEEDEDDDEEDEEPEKREPPGLPGGRARIPPPRLTPTPSTVRARQRSQPRGTKNLPFDCYVCSYKNAAPLRSCLDPVKFRVHSVTCHSLGDKCFTTVTSKGENYEEIVRGCQTDCVDTADTKCCEANRCNNQGFAVPLRTESLVLPLDETSKATKSSPPSVLFFVTILLLLQTVVKVSFV